MSVLHKNTFDQKKQELEPLGYQAVKLPLGMALDNIIQQPHYQNLIIGGLAPEEIIVSKEELMPLKDIVDSFLYYVRCSE